MTMRDHLSIKILLLYLFILLSLGNSGFSFAGLIFSLLFSLWILLIVVLLNQEMSAKLQFHFIRSRFFPGELTLLEYNIMSTFYVLGCITIAKGYVTEADIRYAEDLMDEFKIRPSATAQLVIMHSFNRGKKNTYELEDVVTEFSRFFADNSRACNYYFDYQLTAAMKEGKLLDEELTILTTVASALGMREHAFTQKINSATACYNFKQQFFTRTRAEAKAEAKERQQKGREEARSGAKREQEHRHSDPRFNELENGYNILGVSHSDDFVTIKKAYRWLIKEYHPDKFSAKDVPQAVINKAKEKSQEIIGAYELICRVRGWK